MSKDDKCGATNDVRARFIPPLSIAEDVDGTRWIEDVTGAAVPLESVIDAINGTLSETRLCSKCGAAEGEPCRGNCERRIDGAPSAVDHSDPDNIQSGPCEMVDRMLTGTASAERLTTRRWRCVTKGVGLDAWAEMVPDPNGAYVLASDVESSAPSSAHLATLEELAKDADYAAEVAYDNNIRCGELKTLGARIRALGTAPAAARIPGGWKIEKDGDALILQSPGSLTYVVHADDGDTTAHEALYALVDAMLSAAPSAPSATEFASLRLCAEGSDWKRDAGESLIEWACRKLAGRSKIERAYSAANDYINAMLNPALSAEKRQEFAATYWQHVKDVQ